MHALLLMNTKESGFMKQCKFPHPNKVRLPTHKTDSFKISEFRLKYMNYIEHISAAHYRNKKKKHYLQIGIKLLLLLFLKYKCGSFFPPQQ